MRRVFPSVATVLLVATTLAACDHIEDAQTQGDFPEVMLALQTNIQARGYQVSRVQKVDVGMKKAGYAISEYRVVFFAKAEEVRTILENYPEFASFLPLSITIYRDGEMTRLVGMPFALPKAHASAQELKAMITSWEKDTAEIIRQTAGNDITHQ